MQQNNNAYYAVIFTSKQNAELDGYSAMAKSMYNLARQQDGFLGFESALGEVNISISYLESEESIENGKNNSQHLLAIERGKAEWYKDYTVRVCKVEREYSM